MTDLFSSSFRRQTVILAIAAISVLAVAGLIIGLVLGLRKSKRDSSFSNSHSRNFRYLAAHGYDDQVCGSSHETYQINTSSILGQYSQAAVAVDNAECSTIGREILEKNGTTMDAALAAAICNGVMSAQSMGIGGGCFILIYSK